MRCRLRVCLIHGGFVVELGAQLGDFRDYRQVSSYPAEVLCVY
jgi:hypothetical protein